VTGQQRSGALDVPGHLRDERLDRVEAQRVAQPGDEGQSDVLAVQVEPGLGVQDERLDPPLAAGEGRVVPMLMAAGSERPPPRSSRPA